MVRWLAAHARVGDVGVPSPSVLAILSRVVAPLARLLFRPRLAGWERIPRDRPCLLVANHSGGGFADVACFAVQVLERRETDPRKVTGLAHPLAFFLPGIAWILRGMGAVPSSYEAAAHALGKGAAVLVFPGGDHEAFRPVWQANRVDFAGRQGFLKIAREARVPIVPVGIRGAAFTLPIVWRSRVLAWLMVWPRLFGLKRVPVTLTWLAGSAALGIALADRGALAVLGAIYAFTLLPHLYLLPIVPWTVTLEVGTPLEPDELFGPAGEDRPLAGSYDRVVGAIRQLVSVR